ncbi:MAG: aminotransferase class III-fold pyridoxal phosphate-dependent enzyme [Solirubrobacteraceae bacterium]
MTHTSHPSPPAVGTAAQPAPGGAPRADHDALQAAARDHLLLHFTKHATAFGGPEPATRALLVLERGEGPYVFDTRGRRYIDAFSSLFCSQIGYSYGEEMTAAIGRQLAALPFNTNWSTAHPPAIELAAALAERAPGDLDHVFFTSGGSEAVESMWKIAREHFRTIGQPQRTKAIARHNAYHGVSLGALSFTGVPGFKDGFGTPPVDASHVSNTNAYRAPDGADPDAFRERLLDEVRAAIAAAGPDEVAVIIAEPVQNAGGCLTPPPGYWAGLRRIADEHGILLVADAVICGFGRLGTWLGLEGEDVVPDMVTVAKGITSAYVPGGAVLVGSRVAESLFAPGVVLRHGITFAGHPVMAAVALKNLEIFERDGILDNVRALEGHLASRMDELRTLPIVGDTRGRGFFHAVEMVPGGRSPAEPDRPRDDWPDGVPTGYAADGTPVAPGPGWGRDRFTQSERDELLRAYLPGRLLDAGLIARADDRGDSVLQIAPPLIADRDLLDDIVDRLGEVLADAGRHMQLGV